MNLSDLYRAVKTGYAPDLRTMGYARILRNATASVIKTLSGALPLSFTANGQPLLDYTLYGATVQDGMPTPDAPVDVVGCGDYDAGTELYKIPISVQSEDGSESVKTVYLDKPLYKIGDYADCVVFTEGVVKRQIRELVLTGEENWSGTSKFRIGLSGQIGNIAPICTHYRGVTTASYGDLADGRVTVNGGIGLTLAIYDSINQTSIADWKSYLAEQYAAGTPVKIYYILKVLETDSIALPQIHTVDGMTTIDTITTVKPSCMEIKYR